MFVPRGSGAAASGGREASATRASLALAIERLRNATFIKDRREILAELKVC
jgi:hypothetical protein